MPPSNPGNLERYSRQVLFARIGEAGQRRLMESRVALVGCGALGSVLANTLVRAGVGFLRICDRDYLEMNNLQRQVLYDESDVQSAVPKAIVAARKLTAVNSTVTIEPVVADVTRLNIARIAEDCDLICDGTDNFETRYLLNDFCVSTGRPWIYTAVVEATGLVMPIVPGQTACLRCLFPTPPPPDITPTCETAGIIAPAVNMTASMEAVLALKVLTGQLDEPSRALLSIDAWDGRVTAVNVHSRPNAECVCCAKRHFEYLEGKGETAATVLCGRDAVQVRPSTALERPLDMERLASRLAPLAEGEVRRSSYLLSATIGPLTLTVFPDGRAIIKGAHTPEEARAAYARYVGA